MPKHHVLITLFFLVSISTPVSALDNNRVTQQLDDYFSAWQTRDMQQIGAFFTDGITLYDMPSNSTTSGKKTVTKTMQGAWLTSVPDMVWIKTSPTMISGNSASYEWTYAGTYTGDWWGTAVSGKAFSIKGMSTTIFNEQGQILLQKDFYDLKSFEAQLGL